MRREAAGVALVLALVAGLTWELGWHSHLLPLLARRERIREQSARVRAQKRWARALEAQLKLAEGRVGELGALAREMVPHLVRDQSDALRLVQARDAALRGLADVVLSPEATGGAPAREVFPVLLDPTPALDRLRDAFQKDHPKVLFESWNTPREIEVLRYEERFSLECSYESLFVFLARIEAEPLLVEVTGLKLSGFRSEKGGEPRVNAMVTLSSPGWPAEP